MSTLILSLCLLFMLIITLYRSFTILILTSSLEKTDKTLKCHEVY